MKVIREAWCALFDVAPCAGAWIEGSMPTSLFYEDTVAPCAGAWIEGADLGQGGLP